MGLEGSTTFFKHRRGESGKRRLSPAPQGRWKDRVEYLVSAEYIYDSVIGNIFCIKCLWCVPGSVYLVSAVPW